MKKTTWSNCDVTFTPYEPKIKKINSKYIQSMVFVVGVIVGYLLSLWV